MEIKLVVDGIIVALLAHLGDELTDDLLVGLADGARIRDNLEIELFQVLEQNIAVEGKIPVPPGPADERQSRRSL